MELTLNRERQNREMDDYVELFKRYLSDYRLEGTGIEFVSN
ncbi:hypothetical protein [Vibrio sp. MACH09]|nr:hypothetical protein [Vibrio sp. MACH09]